VKFQLNASGTKFTLAFRTHKSKSFATQTL